MICRKCIYLKGAEVYTSHLQLERLSRSISLRNLLAYRYVFDLFKIPVAIAHV